MSEPTIPNRLSWVASGRRAHGYLVVAGEALHLICLRDESEAAGQAGQATARQFGLVGALIGAGVSAAREASRKKDLLQLYQAQQQVPLEQRVTQHPLSRTIRRGEVTALETAAHLPPTLVLASGRVSIHSEGADAGAALQQWAAAQQVKVEVIPAPKFPWKVIGIIVAIPVALVLLHLLVSVPFALRYQNKFAAAVEARQAFVKQAEAAHAALSSPVGAPFVSQCKQALAGVSPAEVMTYVGQLPENARFKGSAEYERFPQLGLVEPPFGKWDDGKATASQVENRWMKPVSFGRAYGRIVENPLNWGDASSRLYGFPAAPPQRSIVAKVNRVSLPQRESMTVSLSAVVLDEQGSTLCSGDLELLVPPGGRSSSVSRAFQLAHGLPLGLYLPLCGKQQDGACREASHYAELKP